MDLVKTIASELELSYGQVERTVGLLDDGNTLPFIARYRKEVTGNLDEEQLRRLEERLRYLRNLEARKEEVLRLIDEQGKLTRELAKAISEAAKIQEVEEYYRPFRPKRRTRATIAREKGLEPLASMIRAEELLEGDPTEIASRFLNPELEVSTTDEALGGARDIVAEELADAPELRRLVREYLWERALIVTELKETSPAADAYSQYHQHSEPVIRIPPHRVLAINRGEKEGRLKVGIEADTEELLLRLRRWVVREPRAIFTEELQRALEDGFVRLLRPSLEREIRSELAAAAEEQAVEVFSVNLRNLLLQPPVKGKKVLGIDPGFRTGCKVAVVDEIGRVLSTETIYPHPPQNRREEAKEILADLIQDCQVDLVAIGNGTAGRETEELAAEVLSGIHSTVYYCMVSEAGASVYSASPLAREEFPDLDVSMRGAISIARRLQDPLAELVKIEPRSIGVGQYQHDVNQRRLDETLKGVVESCVNYVGVDLNTASGALLQYVAGIGPTLADSIVKHREKNGAFKDRNELLRVKRLGSHTFTQAAGFLRILDGENPLDKTGIHPESYQAAEGLLASLEYQSEDLRDARIFRELQERLKEIKVEEAAERLQIGLPTLKDIIEAMKKPGRDPREEAPGPTFRRDVKSMDDLKPGMILTGEVRNVVDFGAFVDIGVKQDGLVHISELSDRYVKHPTDVIAIGQKVKVRVLAVDTERQRISLSMKGVK